MKRKFKLPSSSNRKICNRFLSKAKCIGRNFKNYHFSNLSLKGSLLRKVNFSSSSFISVDFRGTNIKGCNFSGAKFYKCLFVGARLKSSNFKGATFKSCFFVNQSLSESKNIYIDPTHNTFMQFPDHSGSKILRLRMTELDKVIEGKFKYSRIISLRGGKLNNLTIRLLADQLGEEVVIGKIEKILNLVSSPPLTAKVYSFFEFKRWLDSMQNR